jgi:predicted PurR-regulated permease PerM
MTKPARTLLTHTPATESRTTPADVDVRSIALAVIAFGAATALLYWAREVFIPIVLSILISYALDPIVTGLIRMRLPRAPSTAVPSLRQTR